MFLGEADQIIWMGSLLPAVHFENSMQRLGAEKQHLTTGNTK